MSGHPRGRSAAALTAALVCAAPILRAQTAPPVQEQPVVVQDRDASSAAGQSYTVPVEPHGGEPAVGWTQLTNRVPNLGFETAGTNSFGALYALRGLSNTPFFTEPAVTLYLDDIPMGGAFSYPTDLLGFSSISVFLGPQPTAFGRSSDGGTIVLIPNAYRDGGDLSGGYASHRERFGLLQAGASAEGAGSLIAAVGYVARDGYITNTTLDQKVDNLNTIEAFVRERFQPTSTTDVSIEALVDRHQDGAAPLVPIGAPLFTVARAHEGDTDTSFVGAAIKAGAETSLGRLSETTSLTHWSLNPYADWLVLPPAVQTRLVQNQTLWNEELRLTSLPGVPVSWSLGAWYSGGSADGSASRLANGLLPIQISQYTYGRHEEAVFGEAGTRLAPGLRLSLGGRLQEVAKKYDQAITAPAPAADYLFTRTDRAFLPRAVLSYELDPQTTLAATASFGTKPGGFAAFTNKPALISFNAEHVAAMELSAKRKFAGNALEATVRLFDSEITNYQIERAFSPTDYFVATAPRVRSLGGDTEIAWTPAAGVAIALSAGYTDITLRQFNDPLSGISYAGKRAPYAPLFTAGINASYAPASGWFATAHLNETGKTFYTESENPVDAQKAYAVAGASLGYRYGRWRLSGFIENAFNRGYYTIIEPGVNSAAPGSPRTVGGQAGLAW